MFTLVEGKANLNVKRIGFAAFSAVVGNEDEFFTELFGEKNYEDSLAKGWCFVYKDAKYTVTFNTAKHAYQLYAVDNSTTLDEVKDVRKAIYLDAERKFPGFIEKASKLWDTRAREVQGI